MCINWLMSKENVVLRKMCALRHYLAIKENEKTWFGEKKKNPGGYCSNWM